jgi:hypothetical protein
MARKFSYGHDKHMEIKMTNPRFIVIALIALTMVSGCSRISQSRINPLNWFSPKEAKVILFSTERPADPRPLIDMIVDAALEPLPSGALVRATGRAARQGYWQADLLVNSVDEAGNLIIEFRAIPVQGGGTDSPARSREVTAAVSLRADTLASAKRIIIRGAENETSLRP